MISAERDARSRYIESAVNAGRRDYPSRGFRSPIVPIVSSFGCVPPRKIENVCPRRSRNRFYDDLATRNFPGEASG